MNLTDTYVAEPMSYLGLTVTAGFNPDAMAAEVENALRFVWPDPEPVHIITAETWATRTPAEILAMIEENTAAEMAHEAAAGDRGHLAGLRFINGLVYAEVACERCGHVRLMPDRATLCIPCSAAANVEDPACGAWIDAIFEPTGPLPVIDEDDHDEHPAVLAVDPDITTDQLAALIVEQPMVDVWRGLVAATDPTRAALLWDFAMLAADDLTAPVAA